MNISEGKKKDLILKYIIECNDNKIGASSSEIKRDVLKNVSIVDIEFILKEIENHKPELIKMYFGSTTSYVTKVLFAKPFLDRGGFEKIELKESRQNRKDFLDFNVSKFKFYTFWPIFIFAFVGFWFSVSNFVNNRKNQESAKGQEQRIEQMELELTKLRTSILNRKNLDSLRNPKGLSNEKDK